MNDGIETLKDRNEAKRLENEAARLKRGYVRGNLLPAVTYTFAFIICFYLFRYFCIEGTIFDTTKAPIDRDAYYDAQKNYSDGNLDAAEDRIAIVLAKVPTHSPANQLMVRIAMARGDRKSAIGYLRRALDGSFDREEIAKWIATLEAEIKGMTTTPGW